MGSKWDRKRRKERRLGHAVQSENNRRNRKRALDLENTEHGGTVTAHNVETGEAAQLTPVPLDYRYRRAVVQLLDKLLWITWIAFGLYLLTWWTVGHTHLAATIALAVSFIGCAAFWGSILLDTSDWTRPVTTLSLVWVSVPLGLWAYLLWGALAGWCFGVGLFVVGLIDAIQLTVRGKV